MFSLLAALCGQLSHPVWGHRNQDLDGERVQACTPCPRGWVLCSVSAEPRAGPGQPRAVMVPPPPSDPSALRLAWVLMPLFFLLSSLAHLAYQVVKVKVELVCDMHFPGWWAKLGGGEEQNIVLASKYSHEKSQSPAWPSTDARSDELPCKLDLGEEGETRMFWVEGGPSKTTTLLSTGMQSIEFQLPTQSRQGFPSAFFGQ